MPVFAEDGGKPYFVDGDLMKAIIFICIYRPPGREGKIIDLETINCLLSPDSDPF